MKTINQVLLLITMLLTASPLFGQDLKFKSLGIFRDTLIVKDTVELTCRELPEKELTALIKNDSISITASIDDFLAELRTKVDQHQVDWDIALLEKLELTKRSTLKTEIQELAGLERSRAKFIIATLLEQGKCCVIDVNLGCVIQRMTIVAYLENNSSGRRYYSEAKLLIFEIYDGSF